MQSPFNSQVYYSYNTSSMYAILDIGNSSSQVVYIDMQFIYTRSKQRMSLLASIYRKKARNTPNRAR